MNQFNELSQRQTAFNRRALLSGAAGGFGALAMQALFPNTLLSNDDKLNGTPHGVHNALKGLPHYKPRVKRVIYLFQSGAPSQFETFDYKPAIEKVRGQDLPDSVRQGQRLTGMTSGQKNFPMVNSLFKFAQYGKSGTWMSDLLPHTSKIADDICVIKTMYTEAINHDPAITFMQTGAELAGRPSLGTWAVYGLGSANQDLPGFIVLTSNGTGRPNDQPLYDRLWGSGFLPTRFQGVKFRNTGDPVLFLKDSPGITRTMRRDMLDDLAQLNMIKSEQCHDPEIQTRIAQYEMSYRMQASVPELTDFSKEPKHILDSYGPDVKKPGTYAANCLLARRLAERDVRFIQLYHRGWDHHGGLPKAMKGQCSDTDQATAALVMDLKQRGMLDDTLIIWGGEFGRTVYSQGALTADNYGRDHHPRCFSLWLAGGGIKPGTSYGETDDFSYNIVTPDQKVHVHDLNATIMHLMGIDHTRLTYRFQGRNFRLTDVHGEVVKGILS